MERQPLDFFITDLQQKNCGCSKQDDCAFDPDRECDDDTMCIGTEDDLCPTHHTYGDPCEKVVPFVNILMNAIQQNA